MNPDFQEEDYEYYGLSNPANTSDNILNNFDKINIDTSLYNTVYNKNLTKSSSSINKSFIELARLEKKYNDIEKKRADNIFKTVTGHVTSNLVNKCQFCNARFFKEEALKNKNERKTSLQ